MVKAHLTSVQRLILERAILIGGVPTELHSDREIHFTGDFLCLICKIWIIVQHFQLYLSPRSSGLVERAIRKSKTQLAKIMGAYFLP